MRERRLVKEGSPCDTNLYASGPQTVAEAKKAGPSQCPHFVQCQKGLRPNGFQCVMMMGTTVARFSLDGSSIEEEMRDFRTSPPLDAPKGFVFSRDRKEFVFLTDRREIVREVEAFAHTVLGDQNDQPESGSERRQDEPVVGGRLEDVVAYAYDPKVGAIDLLKMSQLEGRFGTNGSRGCDVNEGPCSCGAWH